MFVGVSTASLYPLLLENAFGELAKGGVKHTEIFVNTHCELSDPYLTQMLDTQKEYGVNVVSVHPFTCGIEPMMLFTDYDRRIVDMLDYYKRFFDYMNRFGAKYFIFHGNKNENSVPKERYFEVFQRLQEAAYANGVEVLHENVCRCTAGKLEFLKDMADALGVHAKFALDTKQALRSGGDPIDFVRTLGEHIKHVHFSDSGVKGDCLKLGDGEYDNPALFRELKNTGFDGCITLELYRSCYNGIADLAENYRLLETAVGNL